MRVAICDDNSFDLKAVQEMFRRVAPGHTLDAFSDGRKLLEAIVAGTRYDLLFLDILMPGISGMELAREVNRVAPPYAEGISHGQRRLCLGSLFCQGAALHP